MGQKVNPISFRLQTSKNWNSRWFASKKDFAVWLAEDGKIRDLIEKRFASRPTIANVEIERSANLVTVTIHTAKAGVVIGRGGAGINELKKVIEKVVSLPVRINVEEVRRPELNAKLVAENIAHQLERRANFRRAVKMAIQGSRNAGAKGIRVEVAGRLNAAARNLLKVQCRCTRYAPMLIFTLRARLVQTVQGSLVSKFGFTRVKGARSNVITEKSCSS